MTKQTPKRKAGQPSKFKPEYATEEFLVEFVQHCKDEKLLVSLCGLAVYVKVCEDTIQEWKRVHPQFSVSLRKIKQISKQQLINKGLNGTYNSTIAKLVLSVNHGMHETKTEEVTFGNPLTVLLGQIDGSSKGKLPDKAERVS